MARPAPSPHPAATPLATARGTRHRWLLFVHQLPATPSNLRVRTWRRLQQVGALPVKQSVYTLPDTPATREDFEWLTAEVKASGGDASVFIADTVDAWTHDALVEEFRQARQDALPTFLLLLIVPMWVSELLRAFAWYIILAFKGPLTFFLMWLGVISAPIHWTWGLGGYSGVIIGLNYAYVLFMLFPLYNAMTSLDTNQIEAAEDLGSTWSRTHWRVIMPHCKPGIASGCVTVFMLSVGSILVPTLVSSPSSRWFTEIIQQWMFESQDWNTGAAYAFMLLIVCTIFVTVMMRVFKVGLADIAK